MTTPLSADDFHAAILAVAKDVKQRRAELDRADASLGDGDTGTMLATAATAVISELEGAEVRSPGQVLELASKAVKGATGSSLGTLIAVGLRFVARSLGDANSVTAEEVKSALSSAAEKMKTAGGAQSGDKTIIDSVEAIANSSLESGAAAKKALDDFRDKPCRAGRARMYPEHSQGVDDPGMLAAKFMAQAVTSI